MACQPDRSSVFQIKGHRKAEKHQSIKTVKQQNENENEKRMILTYNLTDINGRDDEKW
jgi:hypothetical protein